MLKKLKNMIIGAAFLGTMLVPLAAPAATFAQVNCSGIQNCLDQGTCQVDTSNCTNGENAGTKVTDIIKTVINIFSLIVGVIAVIMIIIGGLKYITSGGDSGNVTSAKNTILYAIIGLIIVALSQVIVRFVLDKVTQ